ncbi:FAST kinase domain-containing protein 3, mitochondrial-like [Neocloeon triangulifer]|uniref:FAST kinase domain-containing protein 3, mitochondrial-like n=1 Tax=Neocloeon triangulifer TaxID=2078957 RepID=UPI00286F1EC2|nr:FAST kinase domain-containing protein 3, mitochondrial-like [Neocloeon triangulifer]
MHHIRRCSTRISALLTSNSCELRSVTPLSASFYSGKIAAKWRKPEDLGHTMILVQDGCEINELPVIVRKVNDFIAFDTTSELPPKAPQPSYGEHEDEAVSAIDRCHSLKSLYSLLEILPKEEVTPIIAVHALKRILDLENNHQFRNQENNKDANFTRAAVVSELIDIIVTGKDEASVVRALRIAARDLSGCREHKERLKNEVLVRATENRLNLSLLCDAVRSFAHLRSEDVDKLWVGFVSREAEISEYNVLEMFRVLPFLKESRQAIFQILERKMIGPTGFWWQISPRQTIVGEILALMKSARLSSVRLLAALSKWTNINIHLIKPEHLNCIITAFSSHNYSDNTLKVALERFVKANQKKSKPQAQQSLYSNLMAHIMKFRHRSEMILDGGATFFVKCPNLTPTQIMHHLSAFGHLNYLPKNADQFWKHVETSLDAKFAQFKPTDALNTLLYCIYLQKHPLNFVTRVFNPNFLDRLSDDSMAQPQPEASLVINRFKLQALDAALTLECPTTYNGPLLPKTPTRPVWQDGRIRSMSFYLRDVLSNTERQATSSVLLSELPGIELFMVDLVLHPTVCTWNKKLDNVDRSQCAILLIHVPEHYSRDGKVLTGPQALRKRIFQLLGFKVVDLNYDTLNRLKVHPYAVRQHVAKMMQDK